jgi:hypothetical protein
LAEPEFSNSVFINCPFDKEYEPILQAILFCIIFLGLHPRIASERSDSAQVRLQKITDLIVDCRFSIHDLSRIQATAAGEIFRLNMPFELGLDYGCREFFGNGRDAKVMLILETKPYQYQAAISDLSGCDVASHGGDFQKAVRKVRNWLMSEAGLDAPGAARILGAYADFQEWYYERQLAAGFDEQDIQDYPTAELLAAMKIWMREGKPV